MGQAIVTVLVLIAVVVYAVFFAFWNQDFVHVIGFQWGGQDTGQDMQVAVLPLLGLAVGAVVMAKRERNGGAPSAPSKGQEPANTVDEVNR